MCYGKPPRRPVGSLVACADKEIGRPPHFQVPGHQASAPVIRTCAGGCQPPRGPNAHRLASPHVQRLVAMYQRYYGQLRRSEECPGGDQHL